LAGCKKRQQHFGLNLKPVRLDGQFKEQIQPRQPEAALGVGEFVGGQPGDAAGHPAVGPAADERHVLKLVHPVAHDQRGSGGAGAGKEFGDIGSRVLAIAIEHQSPFKTEVVGATPTGPQGRTFA